MLQLENHSFARREPVDGAIDPAAEFAAHQVALGIGRGTPVRHLIEHIILLAFGIGRNRRVLFADLALAQVI